MLNRAAPGHNPPVNGQGSAQIPMDRALSHREQLIHGFSVFVPQFFFAEHGRSRSVQNLVDTALEVMVFAESREMSMDVMDGLVA